MTVRMPGGPSEGRVPDLVELAEDDLLLDRLGRGEQPAEQDELVATLSEWRAALPSADPPGDELVAAAVSAGRRARRTRRWARGSLVVATAGLLTFGGLTAAAHSAGPGSPLWPFTTWLYPDLAQSRAAVDAAGRAVADARAAIDAGRDESASRLLAQASTLAGQVDDPVARDRLRDEIAALRAELAPPPDTRLPDGPGPGVAESVPDVPRPAPSVPAAPAPNPSEPGAPTSTTARTSVPDAPPLPAPVPTSSLLPGPGTPTVPNLVPGR
ncbi:hypothetical protein [Actinophytocola sp. NPDC049390]|uniref:hypothetical protein n=1 Tax=Actinophytocola sp. NPDC049390 TaxID=3363894 RepID=UPI0037B4C7D0